MKKGFTLVELLAVIVILGIIAGITTPIIRGVIDNSRKESFLDSVNGLVHAVELDKASRGFGIYQVYEIDGNSEDSISPSIPISGSVTGVGEIVVNEDGDIDVLIEFDKWCAYKPIETHIVRLYDAPCIENADSSFANRPYLHKGMIPIRYEGANIVKADNRNPDSSPWYDYENSIWANAVVVHEAHKDNYLNVEPGEIIDNDHILLELVWIPRFKYKVEENPIDIEFVKGAPFVSSPVEGQGYRVHPAFTFGEKSLRGFWASKYQLTGDLDLITSKSTDSVITNQSVNTLYTLVSSMNSSNNPYGFPSGTLSTRVQKNTEWAAISYLAQSEYGIDSSSISVGGSTTNNEYGVYNMVGLPSDFVMSSYNKRIGGSLLSPFPEDKFYDNYTSDNIDQACRGNICYGHGLSETNTFHGGSKDFLTGPRPFLVRGVSEMLDYSNSTGGGSSDEAYRLTISRR